VQRNANLVDVEKMLQNEYLPHCLVAKIVVDTAENELSKVSWKPKIAVTRVIKAEALAGSGLVAVAPLPLPPSKHEPDQLRDEDSQKSIEGAKTGKSGLLDEMPKSWRPDDASATAQTEPEITASTGVFGFCGCERNVPKYSTVSQRMLL
jgi:hypothetical protein